jgi:hypothetical protein
MKNIQMLTLKETNVIQSLIGSTSLASGRRVAKTDLIKDYGWIDKDYLKALGLLEESFPGDVVFGFAHKDLDFLKVQDTYLISSIDDRNKKMEFTGLRRAVLYFVKQS